MKYKVLYPVIFFILLFSLVWVVEGRAQSQVKVKKDTTIILLSDLGVQIDCSQALDDLYNFKFDKAEQQFRWLKQKYKWHPLPYFLMGLIEWWKIMPDLTNKSYDDRFLAYMDTTILVAENLYKKYPPKNENKKFYMHQHSALRVVFIKK